MFTLRPMTGIYLLRGEKILMLHRQGSRVVDGLWVASAGGHFEEHEMKNPVACVLRELREELSLAPEKLRGLSLRYVTLRRVGEEIRQNYYFFAELKEDVPLSSNEGELRWVALDEVLALEMPFSARLMMEHYVSTGRHDDKLYAGVTDDRMMHFAEMKEKP
ncbi:MAG: NUDIX domain-containing protein [Clostridiales bacterium]|nr:NUDIX domain-containing protein [Clostridiales bacterium]